MADASSALTFDALSELLGGRSDRPRRTYWYHGDPAGSFALESLYLKLEAFTRWMHELGAQLPEDAEAPDLERVAHRGTLRARMSEPDPRGLRLPSAWLFRVEFDPDGASLDDAVANGTASPGAADTDLGPDAEPDATVLEPRSPASDRTYIGLDETGLGPDETDLGTLPETRVPSEPSPLVSIGALWLRFLLWNDTHRAVRISGPVLDAMRDHWFEDPPAGDQVASTLRRIFRDEGLAAEPVELLYSSEDRESGSATPADLWHDALLLGIRLASGDPRFGFPASGASGIQPAVRRACGTFRSLTDRTRTTLLGTAGDNRYVLEACDDFLEDLRQIAATAGAAAGDPSQTFPSRDASEKTIIVDFDRPE